jgi:NADH-quinone oxidoreductase subunit N
MTFSELFPAAPEITLLVMICIVLIADLMVSDDNKVITFWLSIAALAVTGWSLLVSAPESPVLLFHGSYISDAF